MAVRHIPRHLRMRKNGICPDESLTLVCGPKRGITHCWSRSVRMPAPYCLAVMTVCWTVCSWESHATRPQTCSLLLTSDTVREKGAMKYWLAESRWRTECEIFALEILYLKLLIVSSLLSSIQPTLVHCPYVVWGNGKSMFFKRVKGSEFPVNNTF